MELFRDNIKDNDKKYMESIAQSGTIHANGGVALWTWNNNKVPLTDIAIPPFIYPMTLYDNWITYAMINSTQRITIDITETVTMIHSKYEGDSHRMLSHVKSTRIGNVLLFQFMKFRQTFMIIGLEDYVNYNLDLVFGNYSAESGTSRSAHYKLTKCNPNDSDTNKESLNLYILKRKHPECRYSNKDATFCNSKINHKVYSKQDIDIRNTLTPKFQNEIRSPHVPIRLEDMLSSLAIQKNIIITASTFNYKEILMAFICNLRRLKVTNYLIFALDYLLYEYLFVRSIPVCYVNSIHASIDINHRNCTLFGTSCYKQVTKLKTRYVSHVLKLGYNVSSYITVTFNDIVLCLIFIMF